MSKVLVTESYLEDIADAIRDKLGVTTTYRPGDMAAAIESIDTAGEMEPLTARANGEYAPTAPIEGFDSVSVEVPTFTASIVQDAVLLSGEQVSVVSDAVDINTANKFINKNITENGTYDPGDDNAQAYSSVTVNVSGGGGGSIKGFELYAADGGGSARQHIGVLNNQYFVCYFDDNMSSTYTLNGQSYTFSTIAAGKQQTLATTRAVADNQNHGLNAILSNGCLFTASHGDSGSYVSVVGGWVGYSTGGAIFENASTGTSNSITLDAAYSKLLVFIGGCFNADGVTSVEINGTTYSIANIGYHYGAYGVYGAIEISGNSDTTITANFSQSGWSYMSIIGFNE